MVIWSGFWHLRVHFRRARPTIFRKHIPSGMGTESLGMIWCIFAENGPLEGGIESSFSGTGGGARGDFWWILGPNSCIFGGPPTICQKHMSFGIGTESVGMIGCILAENGPLEGGIESSFSGTGWGAKGDFRWILGPNGCIFGRDPHHFPNAHALRYRYRKFGNDRMYIRGGWALRRWHWIKFQWYWLGS